MPRKFSTVQGFVEVRDFIFLYIANLKIKFKYFTQLWNYLTLNYVYKDNKNIILYTNQLKLIAEYHIHYHSDYFNISTQTMFKNDKKVIAVKVLDSFVIRDMGYYYGSNKLPVDTCLHLMQHEHIKRWNASYTNKIGTTICIDKIKAKFPAPNAIILNHMLNNTSQGPIIYSSFDEAKNVYAYDVKSAYPAILLCKMPVKFVKTNVYDTSKIYFGKITIKNFKAKNKYFLPLYRGKKTPEKCVLSGKRIFAGEEYSYYGFISHELRLLHYYNYQDVKISDLHECEMDYLPKESLLSIIKMFDLKNNAKGKPEYAGYKQLFNRIFGYFITTKKVDDKLQIRDKSVPYQIGLWIISQQRQIMLDAIDRVGLNNVVSCHTDGIKTFGNYDDVFDYLNKKRGTIYKDIGFWKKEEHIDRIQYYSNTRAKYKIGDEIGMKHGGINETDINNSIRGLKYDEINENTIIKMTIKEAIMEDKRGTFIAKKRIYVPLKQIKDIK